MKDFAVGFIETVGVSAALTGIDVATKAANVELMEYEVSRGGMVIVKLKGDVAAVKSAVEAGAKAAEEINDVRFTNVIARPHQEIIKMIEGECTNVMIERPIKLGRLQKESIEETREVNPDAAETETALKVEDEETGSSKEDRSISKKEEQEVTKQTGKEINREIIELKGDKFELTKDSILEMDYNTLRSICAELDLGGRGKREELQIKLLRYIDSELPEALQDFLKDESEE